MTAAVHLAARLLAQVAHLTAVAAQAVADATAEVPQYVPVERYAEWVLEDWE